MLSFILAGVDRHLYLAAACGVPRPTSCRGAAPGLCSAAGEGLGSVAGDRKYKPSISICTLHEIVLLFPSASLSSVYDVASRMQCTENQIRPFNSLYDESFLPAGNMEDGGLPPGWGCVGVR